MQKYVRKTEVVEAVHFTTNNEPDNRQMDSIVNWLLLIGQKARHDGTCVYYEYHTGHEVVVSVGQWIVVDGGRLLLPFKDSEFRKVFDLCNHQWEAVDDSKYDQCLVCGDTRLFEMYYYGDEVI
jgi:hypothetical protein